MQKVIDNLKKWDNLLLLTHVRPDGDTIGSAAALCRALRDMGKTAYLLYNPEITATYEPYAAPYWAEDGFVPEHIISVDVAALSLLPENAAIYQDRIALAIDHHPSYGGFAAEAYVDPSAAAAGEIVYELITRLTPVTPAIALPQYRLRLLRLRQHHGAHPPHCGGIDGAGGCVGGEQGAVSHQVESASCHGKPHGIGDGAV